MTSRNASLPRRLGAMLYDALLVFAVMFVATLPFVAVRGGEPVEPDDNLAYQLTMLFVIYLFFGYFWSRAGQTLGMRAWRLRLETRDGAVPSFARACLRVSLAILSALPLGLGYLWQLWDRDQLCWHDRFSKTRLRYYPKSG